MLGSHLAEKLKNKSIPFIGTDIEVDITDKTALQQFLSGAQVRWIVICSAYTAVDKAEDEEGAAFAVNAHGIKNIAELCIGTGIKIVNFSTDYVFPGTQTSGYSEGDQTGPESVYGRSKLEGEILLSTLYPDYFIFRISWLYGPYGKNFVHTMQSLFSQRDELNVVNDQFGSPTCTGELSDFIVDLISSDSKKYGIYHFSGEGMTNWYEFALEIYRLSVKYGLTDRNVKINPVDSSQYPTKAKRPAYSYMLKDKLHKTFGYLPKEWKYILEGYIKTIQK
jgi:dTDP-4-dehydrorhamnose reductase